MLKKITNILIFVFIIALYVISFLMIFESFKQRKLEALEAKALDSFEKSVKIEKVTVEEIEDDKTSNMGLDYNGYTLFYFEPLIYELAEEVDVEVRLTATAEGKEAYYLCTCGKAYEDADATTEIADITTYGVIAKLAHDYADATCTDPKTCKNCPATEGEANGHAPKTEWTADEENHWHECENCDEALDEEAHVDANLDSKCDVCGEKTGTDHTLPPQPFN